MADASLALMRARSNANWQPDGVPGFIKSNIFGGWNPNDTSAQFVP